MTDRVAFVTGGAQGIGGGISEALGAHGFRVAVADLNLDAAKETAQRIADAGGKRSPCSSTSPTPSRFAMQSRPPPRNSGDIEVVVNNAGWDDFMPFLQTTEDFWNRILDLNFKGALRVCHTVVPGMVERGFGRVINIGSDAGRVGSSLEAVYSGAKGGIIAFSKTLAREVATKGVTVNTVCPRPPLTPRLRKFADSSGGEDADKVIGGMARSVPMKRLGSPADVAAAVTFFASDSAEYITGQTLSVSGGLTMA